MAGGSLHHLVARALAITGPPEWHYTETGDDYDRLEWLEGDDEDETGGAWVLSGPEGAREDDGMDDVVLEEAVARDLLTSHFRRWLAGRGWQIQMGVRRGTCSWRLADCLGIREGGGDRLDADYPQGEDELAVLCESVVVVATQALPPLPTPPR